jgi:hypothetical protein
MVSSVVIQFPPRKGFASNVGLDLTDDFQKPRLAYTVYNANNSGGLR